MSRHRARRSRKGATARAMKVRGFFVMPMATNRFRPKGKVRNPISTLTINNGSGVTLDKLPSEYFSEHIYTTFQDDWVAFRSADQMNWRRLMWANDFPHSDSTWPWSQEMLQKQAGMLTDAQRRAILSENDAEQYHIDVSALQAA